MKYQALLQVSDGRTDTGKIICLSSYLLSRVSSIAKNTDLQVRTPRECTAILFFLFWLAKSWEIHHHTGEVINKDKENYHNDDKFGRNEMDIWT